MTLESMTHVKSREEALWTSTRSLEHRVGSLALLASHGINQC
jgi:hypothetical protein